MTITEEMRSAGKAAWIRCINNVPNDPFPDAFGEVYRAMHAVSTAEQVCIRCAANIAKARGEQ